MRIFLPLLFAFLTIQCGAQNSWIRINQLGYLPSSPKMAVWCSKKDTAIKTFELVDSATRKVVFKSVVSKPFGAYGPFAQSYRLNFSVVTRPGKYFLRAGKTVSPVFKISADAYKGAADFCLRYMRQQRCGFNPFLSDSCHTHDGYSMYGEAFGVRDSTHIDAVGGWHDASDYLQYVTTSANATYHLLMAYRDFPKVFSDVKAANGLDGKNGMADVLDEAKWGLDWLLKMHPGENSMYNQIADDRDHMGFRIPKEDSFYGKGFERPVYFVTGEPQGLFRYTNLTTGSSSTAAKFASAFALGSEVFYGAATNYSMRLFTASNNAKKYAYRKLGVTQTAPGKAPYFYEEDNWVDDMELTFASAASLSRTLQTTSPFYPDPIPGMIDSSFSYAKKERHTPWLGADTAKHYQWYPFINLGHYELAKQLKDRRRDSVIRFYREGIEKVWSKAKANAFYRGVPFIWCSNNLTTSFAIQCYWYRQLTGDKKYHELEQANFDWLFGLNPWGTSMVFGLPSWGDTPLDPHSAFTKLKGYPIDGGLVDGPVYGSIFNKLLGLKIYNGDEYEQFQSLLAVYHDDYGDYSTNEPTMDGTASLVYLLAAMENEGVKTKKK
jgi:endoglucanase